MTDPTADADQEVTFAAFITSLSDEFDERVNARHALGAEMHQPGEFLTINTMEEALNQLADFANYTRYTFIQMRLLQESLAADAQAVPDSGFMPAKDFTAVRTDG